MIEDYWANAFFSITPTLVMALIFWFGIRALFHADRVERRELEKYEAEERAKRGLTKKP